jgi:LL-diaminopimelate aminotransferase
MRKAKRIAKVPPYLFALIDKKKAEARAKGVDLIDLSIGDPDQPTPKHIVEALKTAADDPSTHNYPPYEGTLSFRQACAKWYQRRFGVSLDANKEIVSLIGSKEGIAHMFMALIDPGDYALIPDPAYPVYKIWTLLCGGKPYLLPMTPKNKFMPDLNKIPKAVLKKAKLLFLNYPNNPTGAICTKDYLIEAVNFCKKNNILLCMDMAYSEMTYDGYKASSVLELPGGMDTAIEFHSLSKTYNMTGWRIGWACGNAEAVSALSIIKTNTDSGIFKAIQQAAVKALEGPQDTIADMNKMYTERRDALVDGLNSLGWKLEKPKGTFYIWAPVPKGYTSMSFCAEVLEKCGVLIVPGNGYGKYGEGYFRAAITTDEIRIKEAIDRLRRNSIRLR